MDLITVFFLLAGIVLLGILGEILFSRTGIPDALLLIGTGILLGPLFGVVPLDALAPVVPFFSALALIIILFEGGLNLRLMDILRDIPDSVKLAFAGFLLSVAAVTAATEALAWLGFLEDWSLFNGLLLGAILGGSSSIIVIPSLQRLHGVKKDLVSVLSIESAITDALVVVVVISLLQFALGQGGQPLTDIVSLVVGSFSTGIVVGAIAGVLWLKMVSDVKALEPYKYLATFGVLLLLYAAIETLQGSGGIAVLTFGLVLGSSEWFYKHIRAEKISLGREVNEFHAQISFFVKTFFFVLIGLLFSTRQEILALAILLTFLLFFSRWAAVKVSIRNSFDAQDKRLASVVMPRGLAAAIMAAYPASLAVGAGSLPGTKMFADVTNAVILVSIVVFTLGVYWAKRGMEKEKQKEIRQNLVRV